MLKNLTNFEPWLYFIFYQPLELIILIRFFYHLQNQVFSSGSTTGSGWEEEGPRPGFEQSNKFWPTSSSWSWPWLKQSLTRTRPSRVFFTKNLEIFCKCQIFSNSLFWFTLVFTSKVSRVGTGRLESPCSMFGPHCEKLNTMFENVFKFTAA